MNEADEFKFQVTVLKERATDTESTSKSEREFQHQPM
jgi:hypothetical protein